MTKGIRFLALLALVAPAAAGALTPAVTLVGPGATDAGTQQLVRTSKNVLYVVPFDCNSGYPDCGANRIHVYQANAAGQATGFTEPDVRHAPALGQVRGTAVAIDGNDVLHLVWIDRSGHGSVVTETFDTRTNRFGSRTFLKTTNWGDATETQGSQGVAIAIDAAGHSHIVYSARGSGANAPIRAWYVNNVAGSWSAPVAIDGDAVPSGGAYSYHPTLAFAPNGDLVTSWLEGSCSITRDSTCYTPGTVFTRVRTAAGTWQPSVALPGTSFVSIDNGPSLLIGADGTRHITFTDATPGKEDQIRYFYDNGSGWRGDDQPAAQVTHDPVLGPDGSGGLYIYGHGAPPADDYSGYGPNKYVFHQAAGSTTWSPWTLYQQGPYDDATSTRWSQFFDYHPEEVDATFWTATSPYTLYVGTLAAGAFGTAAATTRVAAAPEPASWALLIAGFALTGAVARSRRARAVA